MSKKAVVDFLDKYKEQIDSVIADELDRRLKEVKEISPHLVPVVQAMKELSVGGKRLRAMLTLLGYELSGKAIDIEIIKVAAMMEIFHLGLMIQDDFMDRDTLRRGVPTLIARFSDSHVGNFVSMLAGDYTFGWVIEMLASLKMPSAQVNAAMAVWGRYFTRVGYGQTLDGLAIADEGTILKILAMKSGEYSCVLPLLMGATLGSGNKELIVRLEKYGMELGWVFQLRDDWLAEYGDSSKTGKPVGNDSREGKRTFATMNGKAMTEEAIALHMKRGKELAERHKVLVGLVEWMGTRDN
jgi:geranylgeranyl diphosphate synthase type I